MKKLGICLIILILVGTSCFAQSNNDAQRIVGTWKQGSNTVTFNTNGTYAYTGGGGSDNGNFAISGSDLIIKDKDGDVSIYNYYFSPNGRLLVLNFVRAISSGSPYMGNRLWLDKQ